MTEKQDCLVPVLLETDWAK